MNYKKETEVIGIQILLFNSRHHTDLLLGREIEMVSKVSKLNTVSRVSIDCMGFEMDTLRKDMSYRLHVATLFCKYTFLDNHKVEGLQLHFWSRSICQYNRKETG